MYEIWWKDRLLDVVPNAGELPEGLEVRSRRVGELERALREPIDWRFAKYLALMLLLFAAAVATVELTPVVADDTLAPSREIVRLIVPTVPEKTIKPLVAQKLKDKVERMQLAQQAAPRNARERVASIFSIFDTPSGLGNPGMNRTIDDALSRLSGGGSNGPAVDALGIGGPRGNGPGGPGGFGFHVGGLGAGLGRQPSLGLGLRHRDNAGPDGPIKTLVSDGLPRDVVAKVIKRPPAGDRDQATSANCSKINRSPARSRWRSRSVHPET